MKLDFAVSVDSADGTDLAALRADMLAALQGMAGVNSATVAVSTSRPRRVSNDRRDAMIMVGLHAMGGMAPFGALREWLSLVAGRDAMPEYKGNNSLLPTGRTKWYDAARDLAARGLLDEVEGGIAIGHGSEGRWRPTPGRPATYIALTAEGIEFAELAQAELPEDVRQALEGNGDIANLRGLCQLLGETLFPAGEVRTSPSGTRYVGTQERDATPVPEVVTPEEPEVADAPAPRAPRTPRTPRAPRTPK